MKKPNIDEVMNNATEIGRNWTGKQIAMFHYFNSNGLYAQKKLRDAAIDHAVESGQMKSGAIIAFGGFNRYGVDILGDLVMKKRVNSNLLNHSLNWIRSAIKHADEALNEVAA